MTTHLVQNESIAARSTVNPLPECVPSSAASHRTDPLRLEREIHRPERDHPCSFAPLLDEIEIAGWSSDRDRLASTFHDWLSLEGGQVMVSAGQGLNRESDPTESGLIARSVRTAVRAHALHARDAGRLLALVARTLGETSTGGPLASLTVGLIEPMGGGVQLAMAGPCLALRIRATGCTPLPAPQPALGIHAEIVSLHEQVDLRPRERLALITGQSDCFLTRLEAEIKKQFGGLTSEDHRKMTASQTLALVRQGVDMSRNLGDYESTSVVVVRRR